MPRSQVLQAHCNSCGGPRNHLLLKEVSNRWDERVSEFNDIWGKSEYALLQCAGCDEVRLRHRSWFSEETDEHGHPLLKESYYPPAIFRPEPRWLYLLDKHWHITILLREVYKALQNQAPALAAMGLRAVIEAIMIDKVGDAGSFGVNLRAFQDREFISKVQYTSLVAALELGHASIHRGHLPDDFQIQTAVDITENLVHGLYVLEHRAKASVRNLPKRKA